jgi:hypothetical protein
MKRREERRPVRLTWRTAHEKQVPNCQDTKKPRAARPA